MKPYLVFSFLVLVIAAAQEEHENWRSYREAVERENIGSIQAVKGCSEPFMHGISFDCDLQVSRRVPKTVHKLRPGDIKITGAIGDSITAANGAYACTLPQVVNEYRGASWSIGGDANFTSVLTLPNILRLYNPKLIGFSLGVGNVESNSSRFNCAVPGSEASHMLGQAENLVNRIYADRDVDVANDWKVITVFVGGNDVCDHCKNPANFTKEDYVNSLTAALDHLHEKLPRTFVNVVGLINMTQLLQQKQIKCKFVYGLVCDCILNLEPQEVLNIHRLIQDYRDGLRDLANSGRYDTTDDFTVVYQPFMEETKFPLGTDGQIDKSFMAPDCFHLSAKGQALAAKELWTNMLQPVGDKSTAWDPSATIIPCPTKEHPYFATLKNSISNATEASATASSATASSATAKSATAKSATTKSAETTGDNDPTSVTVDSSAPSIALWGILVLGLSVVATLFN